MMNHYMVVKIHRKFGRDLLLILLIEGCWLLALKIIIFFKYLDVILNLVLINRFLLIVIVLLLNLGFLHFQPVLSTVIMRWC